MLIENIHDSWQHEKCTINILNRHYYQGFCCLENPIVYLQTHILSQVNAAPRACWPTWQPPHRPWQPSPPNQPPTPPPRCQPQPRHSRRPQVMWPPPWQRLLPGQPARCQGQLLRQQPRLPRRPPPRQRLRYSMVVSVRCIIFWTYFHDILSK